MAILAIDRDQANWQKRVSVLGVYGFLQGLSLGPLMTLAIEVDPAIVMTAFLGTATIFACFTLSALYSPRRSYLYLGGMLSSAITFLCVLSLVSIFYRPVWMFSIQLYFGLAVFAGYVLYDTQLIVEVRIALTLVASHADVAVADSNFVVVVLFFFYVSCFSESGAGFG